METRALHIWISRSLSQEVEPSAHGTNKKSKHIYWTTLNNSNALVVDLGLHLCPEQENNSLKKKKKA